MKRAAGSFPTGVVVAAANTPTGPAGLTLQSFVSLSLDPPLIQLSVAKTSGSWQAIRDAGSFSLSILAANQSAIALQFAQRNCDKFHGMLLKPAPVTGNPQLAEAVAWFDCEIEAVYPGGGGGDHDIVVGKVLDARTPTHLAIPWSSTNHISPDSPHPPAGH